MTPRRPPAPAAESGQRPATSTGGLYHGGRPLGPPAGKARPGRAPASRPAASTRPRSGSAGRTEGARGGTRAGSGRPLWVLGAVGIVLALLILPYFQKWLIQRSEIESARAEVAQSQREVAGLETQRARWQDDNYVMAQARDRLNYVLPGEIGLVVEDPEQPDTVDKDPDTRNTRVPGSDQPWFADVWHSAVVSSR